ncbi:MAG: DNA ligase D, partial [Candidatus Binatia bacterium]
MSRPAPLPKTFDAQLATLVKSAPDGDGWLHEIKIDGYRIGCRIERGAVRLLSRRGNDWTERFPAVGDAARELAVERALLDGEVAVVLPDGRTSFQALQNALGDGRAANLVYFVFDCLHLEGVDVSREPLERRKERLRELVGRSRGVIRFSDHVIGGGAAFFREACRLGLEGIVSKRLGVAYRSGRSDAWLKTKCTRRQELVICGFTDPEGSREGIGALLVGVHDAAGKLVFAGKVGTGFTQKSARDLRSRLEAIERKTVPLAERPPGWLGRNAHWVEPKLVCEVAFTEWTDDGKIRHPSFQGLREDKRPAEVVRERPANPGPAARQKPAALRNDAADVVGVRITHPERVLYPDAGVTKLDVARYYETIADWVLPHLLGRPLTLVRCPEGIGAECFFMKHSKVWAPEALRRVRIREKTKTGEYLVVESLAGLIGLVQMDVLEVHTWNSTIESLERPDRIVVDLDPGPEVKWAQVIEGARLVRARLERHGLQSFVKNTGGRGLHVVVPLVPERDWSECLAFARSLAEEIVRHDPQTYTTAFAKAGRERKILVDVLRNNRTNTS